MIINNEFYTNVTGLIVSFIFLLSILIIGYLLSKSNSFSSEIVRKFIHIGVSNWYFIYSKYLTRIEFSIIGPGAFIVLNSLATFLGWTRYFKLNDKRRNYGLIYFPISLVILIIFNHYNVIPKYVVGVACLVMGYGDGLAALMGMKFGRKRIFTNKTYVGSITMFSVTITIMYLFSYYYSLYWFDTFEKTFSFIVLSLVLTIIEMMTPFGLDNLTVPLSTAFGIYLLSKH